MNEYKSDIISTRRGALGSSDGKLIISVAESGIIQKSAYKRLAVCKGLIEQEEIPQTAAVRAGDELEMLVFENLKANNDKYLSNPRWISEKYSRKNVKLLTHPDIVLQDDENKILNVYEVKCTKFTFEQTRYTYKAQLIIHWLIANEIAKKLGGYKVRLSLVHYSTYGMNLEDGFEFEPSRLTVKALRGMGKLSKSYRIGEAMDIIDSFLESFNEYFVGDEIDANMLPTKVKTQFDEIANVLSEIKQREEKVEAFKAKLYSFMLGKEIKSIKCDAFSITRVDGSIAKSFDYKTFLEDERIKHPRKTRSLENKYTKETKKRGYCQIKVNKNKDVEDIFK